MFIDRVKIQIESGAGGNGMVAWRREKYVPFGGPAGGDGGRGGTVYIEATSDLQTLLDFKYQSKFKAMDGERGRSKNQHGKAGEDLTIRVPCGTIVRDAESGDAIADLVNAGDKVMVATGGRGGRGNSRFLSSARKAPQFAEPGEPGIIRDLDMELKLIAEVGIIGLPNAGKSTLISVISAAKPKIADYPFTTLVPNLGVIRKPSGDGVVVADIPGLIEGASEGSGLGHEFLRHVERTRVLLHLVAMTNDDPLVDFQIINKELAVYSQRLTTKPQLVALTKADAVEPERLSELKRQFEATLNQPIYVISSVTRHGLDGLMQELYRVLDDPSTKQDEPIVEVVEDTKASNNDDSAFEVLRKNNTYLVSGGKIERLFNVTDMRNKAAVHRYMNILKAMGVFDALKQAGIQEGDTVQIMDQAFDYYPDNEDETSSKVQEFDSEDDD